MDINEAHSYISSRLAIDSSKFYTSGSNLPLGVGKLYEGVRFSVYIEEKAKFSNCDGQVIVLSHECDIDPSNARSFNDYLLICPIIDFHGFIDEFNDHASDGHIKSFLSHLADHKISRVIYIPHYQPNMPYGGLLYLNQITNTHVSELSLLKVKEIGSLTAPGLQVVDYSLVNHLLRQKSVSLAFSR